MANKGTKVLNIFIGFGTVFFIAVCIIAFLKEELLSTNSVVTIILLLQILLGAFIVNTAILLTKKAYQFFLGLIIGGWGILLYLMHFSLPFTMYQMWPVFLLLAGIFLLIAGIYKYKKFKYGFGIPSIVLMIMAIWYMMFSFKIIKIPFSIVSTVLGPAFMFLIGVGLIVFFFVQQKHSEFVVHDEDRGTFEDEEIDHPQLGK